jgi:4-amino-4-deoxy-L-arabinose transferase-like glycosyltransferase
MAENPAPNPSRASSVPARVAILLALTVPLIFIGLGSIALLEPDEPYYAVPAREMLRTGSWQVPIFHGEPWFDKPILFYWMILGAYRLFGVSELSARIGSALMGVATIVLVYLFGRRASLGERAAFAAALILATNIEVPLMARTAVTDMTLTATLTLGMLAVARYLETGLILWASVAGSALGLATLTKGPVGLLLPGVALLAYAALARRRDLFRLKPLAAGTAFFLLVAAPWYVYMILVHRDLLLKTFIGEGNLGRFLHPEHVWFPGYYLAVLAAGFLPWSGGLPAALFDGARPGRSAGEREPGRPPGALYEICWFGSVLGVFSLSASKLPSYLLPAFPPGAMLLARYWQSRLETRQGARSRLGPLGGACLGVLFAGGAVWAAVTYGSSQKQHAAGTAAIAIAAVLLLGSLLGVVAVARRSLAALCITQATAAVAAILILVCVAMPRIEPLVSARPLVAELERRGVAGDVVGTYRQSREFSLDYYLGRSTVRANNLPALQRLAADSPGGIWVLRTGDIERLALEPTLDAALVLIGPDLSAVRITTK